MRPDYLGATTAAGAAAAGAGLAMTTGTTDAKLMRRADAKKWVDRHFGSQLRFDKSKSTPLLEDDFIAALAHKDHLPRASNKDRQATELFLWAGCCKFDRWFTPSPPSVPETYQTRFRAFVEALTAFETPPTNAPVFAVHVLKDELYATFDGKRLPLDQPDLDKLADIYQRLANVSVPRKAIKQAEMLEARADLNTLIASMRAGTLVTRLRAGLPYPLARAPIDFNLVWQGLNVQGLIRSDFKAPSALLAQAMLPMALTPVTSTRWQYGTSEFELAFNALIDPSRQVPALQVPAVDVPTDAWPNGLHIAFELIYLACWSLRSDPSYVGIWVPAPGDIGSIESTIDIPGREGLAMIRRGHPCTVHLGFVPTTEVKKIDLGVASLIPWYLRCRILADQYAALGEVREAIFWLNVGVEALIRTRMTERIAASNSSIDMDAMVGAVAYWDEARGLVADQFPEIADKITWPDGGRKPSLFQQLRYFCRNVPDAPDYRTVKGHYSKVSRHRNDLFHGENMTTIPIAVIKTAMASFDWLTDNF